MNSVHKSVQNKRKNRISGLVPFKYLNLKLRKVSIKTIDTMPYPATRKKCINGLVR